MSDAVIKVDNVYKAFKIPHEKSNSLKAAAINIFKKKTYTKYEAARGISFEVKEGEFLGIIGRNGSGKSTMLKMLAGIYIPDKGKITVDGHLSPFLELGVGFNPELSARDNVYLNGTILGLTRKEIDAKFDEIIGFGELEEFVDQKLKNFSSGMQVRLAFSVAIQAHAEILLIDEVLAVGDTNFQRKCFEVFYRLKKEGRTIVFVTHSMDMVKRFCDRVILIHDGLVFAEGDVSRVTDEYSKINLQASNEIKKAGSHLKDNNWGDRQLEILDLEFKTNGKKVEPIFNVGEPVEFVIKYRNNTKKKLPLNAAIGIYNGNVKCFDTNTYYLEKEMFAEAGKEGQISLLVENLNLLPDEYSINLSLSGSEEEIKFHAIGSFKEFVVRGEDESASGIAKLDFSWKEPNVKKEAKKNIRK